MGLRNSQVGTEALVGSGASPLMTSHPQVSSHKAAMQNGIGGTLMNTLSMLFHHFKIDVCLVVIGSFADQPAGAVTKHNPPPFFVQGLSSAVVAEAMRKNVGESVEMLGTMLVKGWENLENA